MPCRAFVPLGQGAPAAPSSAVSPSPRSSLPTLAPFGTPAGERPAVAQPPGLAPGIALRPYQLQSLAFMLEVERLVDRPAGRHVAGVPGVSGGGVDAADPDAADGGCPGGYRRLLWVPVSGGRGQRYWYSPVLERLSLEVPEQTTGGFLGEPGRVLLWTKQSLQSRLASGPTRRGA